MCLAYWPRSEDNTSQKQPPDKILRLFSATYGMVGDSPAVGKSLGLDDQQASVPPCSKAHLGTKSCG